MKRYIVIPGALLIYSIVMAYFGWETIFEQGKSTMFLIASAVELFLIVVLYFLFRHLDKERIEKRRRRQSADRRSLL